MQPGTFVLKGDICYNTSPHDVRCVSQGYVVCQEGISAGVFDELPHEFAAYPCIDCGPQLIIPGLCDLHLHAPQYSFRGLGMDLELLEWLTTHTFPEEARYAELSYARRAYTIFADALQASPTTRAIIFGTLHVPATEYLMDALEATGLETYVGKVNMDRNSPEYLCETTAESVHRTITWLEDIHGCYTHTHPIITPRFTPSCSDELRAELGRIRAHYHLPVQSHLSENISEVAWVKELCPDADSYGDTYARWGLFGMDDGLKTVMAHAVYSSEAEVELLRATGIYVAHCPQSNAQLASGIAPIRCYIDAGILRWDSVPILQVVPHSLCFAVLPMRLLYPSFVGGLLMNTLHPLRHKKRSGLSRQVEDHFLVVWAVLRRTMNLMCLFLTILVSQLRVS